MPLHNLDSFGDVAAEDDSVLKYFLTTDAVNDISQNRAFLVLGRKGSGKTAIVRFFTEKTDNKSSKQLNLRNYPWNVHAQRIDHGMSDIEAYVSSWRYLIGVQLASLTLSQCAPKSHPSATMLQTFLQDYYGGASPELADILRPKKLRITTFSIRPSIMGNQLGGVEMDRKDRSHAFGLKLNALASSIIDAVLQIMRDFHLPMLSLHFDELDQGLSRLDDQRSRMLIGLVLAAREVRRECKAVNAEVNPVVYLRTDLWDDMDFSDKNKISTTSTLHLTWNSESLLDIINTRLRAKLSQATTWKDIIDEKLMRRSQEKWNHITARTFNRPRDVIRFLNAILQKAKTRQRDVATISNKDIVDAREEYSKYLKQELDDEIKPHWQAWPEAIQACSSISTITFDKSRFLIESNKEKTAANLLDGDEALAMLYRFSVISYERRSGYGGTKWVFQYLEPDSRWDSAATRFKVHLGLKEFARLREERIA